MRVSASRLSLLILLFVLSAGIPRASAQFDTASVVGTVKDASGAIVPDAKVTLTNTQTGVSVVRTTSGDGNYEFVTVRPGIYLVSAEKAGFSIALMDNVEVQVAARLRVDLQMAVGQLSERVVVTGASPLVETDTSQRSQVITGEQMRELALNGREYSALALLSTGVRQSALNKSSSANGTPREGAFNVNGLRSTFNNFLIDGVDNNAYGTSNQGFSNQVMQPPPDAVSEFRVVTNNQSAEYGRAAGATVNVAYRSGTNQIHGDAWEFFRDTALNAETYFKPADGSKPPLRRNQYRRHAGRTAGPEQGVLLRRLRRVPPGQEGDRFFDAADRDAERRHPQRRHSRSAHRRRLSRRHADSDDRLRAQRARRPARAERGRRREQLLDRTGLHQRHRQGGRQGRSPDQPGALAVRPLRLAQPEHQRSAAGTAAVRRRRQRQHLHPQQAAGSGDHLHRVGALAARGPLRLVEHAGRQESTGARQLRQLQHLRTADRSAHRRRPAVAGDHRLHGVRTPGDQPAVAVPDRVEPEGQLLQADGPPVDQGGLRVPAHQRRGAGRESAVRPRQLHRPVHQAGEHAPGEQPVQPRGFHARTALAVRAQHLPGREHGAGPALHLRAGRHPRQRQGDAQRRPALRGTRRRCGRPTTC